MMKIEKRLYIGVISICVSACLFAHTIAYAAPNLRNNLIFDEINSGQDVKRASESLSYGPPAREYSFADFIRNIKFSDFVETIKSDTGGQLFGRFVALLSLLLATTVILILAPFVKIGSPGPIFFGQERLGYKGKPIIVLKLRTFTNEGDVDLRRITPFGNATRHTGLDELPQILSIVLGDMQWFGPRPYTKRKIPYQLRREYRNIVLSKSKPGIFSWARLSLGIGTSKYLTKELLYAYSRDIKEQSISNNTLLLFTTALHIARSCLNNSYNKTLLLSDPRGEITNYDDKAESVNIENICSTIRSSIYTSILRGHKNSFMIDIARSSIKNSNGLDLVELIKKNSIKIYKDTKSIVWIYHEAGDVYMGINVETGLSASKEKTKAFRAAMIRSHTRWIKEQRNETNNSL